MDIETLIEQYTHPSSILKVECDDKKIQITDLSITKDDIKLLNDALSKCEEIIEKSIKEPLDLFTPEQQSKLKYLDLYLNIPVLGLFYAKRNYDLFANLVNSDCICIPINIFDIDSLITICYNRGTKKIFEWLLSRRHIIKNEELARRVAEQGNLEGLKYLHENNCP